MLTLKDVTADGPILMKSSKLEALMIELEATRKQDPKIKSIVFSQFTMVSKVENIQLIS
jgi:hypothetical protein